MTGGENRGNIPGRKEPAPSFGDQRGASTADVLTEEAGLNTGSSGIELSMTYSRVNLEIAHFPISLWN